MIQNLSAQNSVFNNFLQQVRDKSIQQDSMRFRRNLERMGEIIAYEISKTLRYEDTQVETVLGEATIPVIADDIVLATILRAGLPMHQGMLNIFDNAQNAFISAFRNYEKDGNFEIEFGYISSPEIDRKVVILSDPMLATGASMELAYRAMLEKGTPRHTHIVALIASREGVDYIQKHLSHERYTLWVGAVDDELTAHAYIVPGLGDAGDLAYGSKV